MSTLPKTRHSHAGRDYETQLMAASDALRLLPRIMRVFGAPLMQLLSASDGDTEAALAQLGKGSAVITLAREISEVCAADPDALLVLRDVLRYTECDQVKLAGGTLVKASVYENFDTHFAGAYGELMAVAVQAAQASFVKPSGG